MEKYRFAAVPPFVSEPFSGILMAGKGRCAEKQAGADHAQRFAGCRSPTAIG
jgi:hypothetical protein